MRVECSDGYYVSWCRSSCQYWSTSDPHKLVEYTLTVHAPPPADDSDDLIVTCLHNSCTQQEDDGSMWLCMESTLGDSTDDGVWSTLTPSPAPSSPLPAQLQATYALLNIADGFPVTDRLKTFRIPRHTSTRPSPPPPPPAPPRPPPCPSSSTCL